MAKIGSTPEEQLLNLIEESKGFAGLDRKRKAALSVFGNVSKIWKAPLFVYESIKRRFGRLKVEGKKDTSLKPVIRVLFMIAIVLTGYLVIDFIFESPDINHIYERISPAKDQLQEDIEPAGRTFLSYLAMVQSRNIFSSLVIEGAQQVGIEEERKTIKQEIAQLSAGLRLAGISLSPKPQVMIENKETNETLFLKKGDAINKLTIQKIFADRVILSYQGETIELL